MLDELSLEVLTGETLVIIGCSGCGKSVLLKHIVGLMRPDRGKVFFDGQEISNLNEQQLDQRASDQLHHHGQPELEPQTLVSATL